ncbi:STAS domain-containing protein [Pseudokineococcus basanitobsidens]|uniref:STAS domain-containing protein n=1 Tax=Pseudokineococcus basanitobsidens TaxID=1926649 RepID=A0ABU8RL34_9ACTN
MADDLDLRTAPRLAERVLDLVRCGASVAVDTSAVAFVDCCGLAALERCVAEGRGEVSLEPVGVAVERLRHLVELSGRAVPSAG